MKRKNVLDKKSYRGGMRRFTALYNKYLVPVYRYIVSRTSKKEAEDLTQDVFMKVLNGLGNFDGSSEGAWIFTIARNVVIDHYRKKKDVLVGFEVNRTGSGTENIDKKEAKQIVEQILEQMGSEESELLRMKFFAGLENEDLASMLGCTAGAAAVRVHRALKSFREHAYKLEIG